MIPTTCSRCGKQQNIPLHYLEKDVKCPHCSASYKAIPTSNLTNQSETEISKNGQQAFGTSQKIGIGIVATVLAIGFWVVFVGEDSRQRTQYNYAVEMEQTPSGDRSHKTIDEYRKSIRIAPGTKLAEKAQQRIDKIQSNMNTRDNSFLSMPPTSTVPVFSSPSFESIEKERRLESIESKLDEIQRKQTWDRLFDKK